MLIERVGAQEHREVGIRRCGGEIDGKWVPEGCSCDTSSMHSAHKGSDQRHSILIRRHQSTCSYNVVLVHVSPLPFPRERFRNLHS